MPKQRISITLEPELLKEIDRVADNRSRFLVEAVRRELERLRREALRQSLDAPHPESEGFADLGFTQWVREGADDENLLDPSSETPVRWTPGEGWRVLGE